MDSAVGSPTSFEAMVGLLFAAMLGTWVYFDARSRGASRPGLWGVGTFLFAIVVLPVWLLKRPPAPAAPEGEGAPERERAPERPRVRSGPRRCPWCGDPIQPAAVVCMHCGRDVPPDP